jgi:phospho-N-acetylmuramoyl-pentapeptide-transferase
VVALLIAGAVAVAVPLLGMPLFIRALAARGIGQPVQEELLEMHAHKHGTPTMGGVMIVAGAVLGYMAAHIRGGTIFTWGGLLTMGAVIGAGFVGFLDDFIKVRNERNLGLRARTKMVGLLVVGIVFAVLAIRLADVHTTLSFTDFSRPGIDLGRIGWVALAVVMIAATTNGVNLADGLDGLAAGSAALCFSAFVVIGFWEFRHVEYYQVPQALDLALVAASMMGACTGFLWWNAAPAKIIMGDVGALAIGAGLAALALFTSTQLLLPLIGALYVIESLSVIIQVAIFKATRKRVFRMSPIHNHFELGGWAETAVVIRFWIGVAMTTALALGIFYATFITNGGIDT